LKKLAFLGAAVGVAVGALVAVTTTGHAADHLDAPGVQTMPMADITDVYVWTTSDASKVNLIMNVSPGDDGTRHFGPSLLYVFHVTSTAGFGMAGTETKVICKFASDTSAQCWVGTTGYVAGDPSGATGVASADGKVKLFAGRRSDPFFFNLQGFKDAVAVVDGAEGMTGTGLDTLKGVDGCITSSTSTETTAGVLRTCLLQDPNGTLAGTNCPGHTSTMAPCSTTSPDCFISLNVMSIVLQIDRTLLNSGTNKVLSVWGSTNSPM
jgi:hypothetical protein